MKNVFLHFNDMFSLLNCKTLNRQNNPINKLWAKTVCKTQVGDGSHKRWLARPLCHCGDNFYC